MNQIYALITELSIEPTPTTALQSPRYWCVRLLSVLTIYGVVVQLCLGLRPDFATQFLRPFFVLEIGLLTSLLLVTTIASVLAMYPDAYQKPKLLWLPYVCFVFLLGILAVQFVLPDDARMVMPDAGAHAVKCAFCIGAIALAPAALIFALLSKGASVHPLQAGAFAVLTASCLGCLIQRLAETNDSMWHLVNWHYLPTLFFAVLGAVVGKWLLEW
jgi:hypothetical protein